MINWLAGSNQNHQLPQGAPKEQSITFGLEFEFLVPIERRNVSSDPLTSGRYFTPFEEYNKFGVPPTRPAQVCIAEVLNNAQMLAVSILDQYGGKDPILHRQLASDYYSVWRVRSDSTVRPDTISPSRKRRLIGLEVNSPKLPAEEAGFVEVQMLRKPFD